MTTVQQLIDVLEKIEDKNLGVLILMDNSNSLIPPVLSGISNVDVITAGKDEDGGIFEDEKFWDNIPLENIKDYVLLC
jgi:hypothetical protein